MVFNFDKPKTKDFTETVRLLANLSRFVIVDVTNPRSTPLELRQLSRITWSRSPRFWRGQAPFAMFVDLQNKYDWVLPAIVYPSVDRLIEVLEGEIIGPAQAKFPSACLDGRNDSFKDQYPKANQRPDMLTPIDPIFIPALDFRHPSASTQRPRLLGRRRQYSLRPACLRSAKFDH